MREKLLKLLDNSYSPYYNFPVSAIVVMNDGSEFSGVNVENANGTSICAERNAIHNAIANGYKKGDFKCIYLMALKNDNITPCFACRQVLLEFFDMDSLIIIVSKDGNEIKYKLRELCPHVFNGESL